MTEIKVSKTVVSIQTREIYTSGASKVFPCTFAFGTAWDGLTRTAVFKCDSTAISVALDDDNACDIPWEVLQYPQKELCIGVYGTRGEEIVLPTIWGSLGIVREGTAQGDNASEPTPDVYQQILAQIEAGKLVGPQGEQGEPGPRGIGIQYIELTKGTHAPGTLDTYTVTFDDGSTFDYQVYNGKNGAGGGGGGVDFTTDETLSLENGVLSVNRATTSEENNTLPITAAAVYTEIGNINVLLQTI